jgi:hypothetical protein
MSEVYCPVSFLGALSDERSGLSLVSICLQSLVKVIYIFTFFVLHTISIHNIDLIKGLYQSRLSTAVYALLFTSSSCYRGSLDT